MTELRNHLPEDKAAMVSSIALFTLLKLYWALTDAMFVLITVIVLLLQADAFAGMARRLRGWGWSAPIGDHAYRAWYGKRPNAQMFRDLCDFFAHFGCGRKLTAGRSGV
jgi:hypothetical protein